MSLEWTRTASPKPLSDGDHLGEGSKGGTWRHTVMAELKEMGLTWGEAQHPAKDHPTWDEEN